MTQQKNGGNGMRLFRHGPLGSEAAGAVDARGVKRDISLLAPDFTPDWLAPEKLNALSAIDLEKMPQVPEGARIGAPVAGSRYCSSPLARLTTAPPSVVPTFPVTRC